MHNSKTRTRGSQTTTERSISIIAGRKGTIGANVRSSPMRRTSGKHGHRRSYRRATSHQDIQRKSDRMGNSGKYQETSYGIDKESHLTKRGRNTRTKRTVGGAQTSTNYDPTREALQECQIVLPLGHLLQLVPRFIEGLKTTFTAPNPEPAPAFFSNPEEGPVGVDTSSPTITVIIKGKEIIGTIIDGGFLGSGVNIISQ